MVFLDMVSNDLPERCYNTGTSFLGTYTHRWCWSCIYEDNWTPSCRHCELYRVNNILCGRDGDAMTRSCDKCSDWWSPSREHVHTNADVYPIAPADLYTIAPEEKEDCPIPYRRVECPDHRSRADARDASDTRYWLCRRCPTRLPDHRGPGRAG